VAAAEQLRLETDLRRAVEQQEFVLHFQPIMNLLQGGLRGFEALIRWDCPERGMLLPAEFLEVAENTGLIVPIGEWVLAQACRQMSLWHENLKGEEKPRISVNVSAKQVAHEGFSQSVLSTLDQTGLPPKYLILELTESTLLQHLESVHSILATLRDRGIGICLDDFGTGYSSLSYLQKLPVDTLKIDRAFVKEMNTRSRDRELVRTILQIGRDLGLAVIAEGIETTEQLTELRSLDCTLGQGFTLARPVPAREAFEFLRARQE
jgi:EAL domain-containing protein (putative c-di-GMP-specific phosphodiesterase class I)